MTPYVDTDLDNSHEKLVVPQRRAQVTLSPTSRGFNLEGITLGKAKYEHKVSKCGCQDLAVYVDFGNVYTCCKEHGWVDLGTASRIYSTAVRS